MNSTLPTITLVVSALVACSGNAFEAHERQTSNQSTFAPVDAETGKADRSPPAAPLAPAASAPTAVLTATTAGDLCLIDPESGAIIDVESSTAIDILTSPDRPFHAVASGWSEDGGGTLLDYDVSADQLTLGEQEALYFEDTRLLYGPAPTVALGTNEGTTLFVGGEGRAVFGSSSFLAQPSDAGLDIFLLERASKDPRLLHLRWEGGLREVEQFPVPTPSLSCAPRLVRDAQEPLIASMSEGTLFISTPDGTSRARLDNAAALDACVEDALWLDGTEEVAIVTGPDVRAHLLATNGEHDGETLVMAGQLWHDPRPHRRLAYDPSRSRLWIALSERLEARTRTQGHLEPVDVWQNGCDAESVALVW